MGETSVCQRRVGVLQSNQVALNLSMYWLSRAAPVAQHHAQAVSHVVQFFCVVTGVVDRIGTRVSAARSRAFQPLVKAETRGPSPR